MTLSAKHRSAVPPALRSPYSGTTTARGKPAVNNSYPDFYISTATQALLGRMNRVINSSPCRRADSNSLCSSATDTPAALVHQSCLQHLQQPRGRFLLFWAAARRMPAGSSCSLTNQGGGFSPEKEPCVTPACANPPPEEGIRLRLRCCHRDNALRAVLELAPSNQPAWVTSLLVHLILGTDNITTVKELRFGEQEPDFLQPVTSRGIPSMAAQPALSP